MSSVFRRSFGFAVLFLPFIGVSASIAQIPQTTLQRQLSRTDLAVNGVGEFSTNTTGLNFQNTTLAQPQVSVSQQPSNTLAALVTLRYVLSPWVGLEGNYGYARYTQNFISNPSYIPGGVQANASEYTLGYVVHPPSLFGVQPFVSAGLGTIAFKPTPFGGEGLQEQARAAYYYSVGADRMISPHFGIRASFRQLLYLGPDFGQNYLTIKQRTITSEPGIGIFARF